MYIGIAGGSLNFLCCLLSFVFIAAQEGHVITRLGSNLAGDGFTDGSGGAGDQDDALVVVCFFYHAGNYPRRMNSRTSKKTDESGWMVWLLPKSLLAFGKGFFDERSYFRASGSLKGAYFDVAQFFAGALH